MNQVQGLCRMMKFDFSQYEDSGIPEVKKKPETTTTQKAAQPTTKFDFEQYEDASNPRNQKMSLHYSHLTPVEFEKLSDAEKKELREYTPLTGLIKGAIKSVSLGASETYPGSLGLVGALLGDRLKIKEHEKQAARVGEFLGDFAPISLGFKGIQASLKMIPNAYKWGRRIYQTAAATALGGGLEASKEAIAGEELDPANIAFHGALFGAFDTVLRTVPKAWNWLKDLNPKQKNAVLVKGLAPEELSPTQYKFFEEEVVPKMKKIGEEEYQSGMNKSIEKANKQYENEINNIKALHENDLNKVQESKLKYETEVQDIQQANKQALEEYEASQAEWDNTVKRQKMVDDAIKNTDQKASSSLSQRVKPEGEDIGFRPDAPYQPATELEESVGKIFSKERITNETAAGEKNIKTVKASDKADYEFVQNKYKISDELNSEIEATHEDLANNVQNMVGELETIELRSPVQEKQLSSGKKVLNQLIEFDEGAAVAYKKVNNQVLLDEAKALRQSMSYDFAHGNSFGQLSPLMNMLQDAAESAAVLVGKPQAALANQVARTAYKDWAAIYQSKLIRKYRSSTNTSPTKTFKSSLNIDDYTQLDKVLSRSNTGQNLSAQTRRELINKELKPFLEDPNVIRSKFDYKLKQLEPVLKEGEEELIRRSFADARRKPFDVKKLPGMKEPKELKLSSIPNKKFEDIKSVKVPFKPKPEITPEMKYAAKMMKITPEDAIKLTDTPTGLKKMKEILSPSPKAGQPPNNAGQQLYREIGKRKIKDILFQGKPQQIFKGEEMYKILNTGDNFNMISEILGEDVALEILNAAKELGQKNLTIESLMKFAKKGVVVKTAVLFGIV